MANNGNFDLKHGILEENALCQNYIENIAYVKNIWNFAKMADFLGKIRIFVINLPISMGNVDLKKLFDIDLRFCNYLG